MVVWRRPPTSRRGPVSSSATSALSSVSAASPGTMPAAGEMPSVLASLLFGGKHKLMCDDGAVSTGDTGPAAKRPRTAIAVKPSSRQLAMRLFAFNDWRSCLEPDEQGNIPLHCAVLVGDINQIKRQCCVLNARDHSLDICNNDGETPLHLAVVHERADAVEELIKFGAKPDFRDGSGNTAFHLAVQRDAHCLGILKSLLAAPKLEKSDIQLYNDDGYAPLHLCAMYDKVEELKALIFRGADVNLKDTKSGRTPLFHAVETNSGACCRALLANGASSTEQNYAGHTPIIAASEFGNGNIESVLPQQNLKLIGEDIITQ